MLSKHNPKISISEMKWRCKGSLKKRLWGEETSLAKGNKNLPKSKKKNKGVIQAFKSQKSPIKNQNGSLLLSRVWDKGKDKERVPTHVGVST